MGAAEVSALLKDYRGSFILTFAGYNAGRGRVQQWVAQHGDPRDSKIDAVDWVERIPFAETRNYVQRVMENLQVYRTRFDTSIATLEPNLHRSAMVETSTDEAPVPGVPDHGPQSVDDEAPVPGVPDHGPQSVLTPVSSLSGAAQITGRAFPMTFFVPFSVGTFTKGLGFEALAGTALAIFVPVLSLISLMLLRKQER
jgi:hypothetical protein